MKSAEAPNNSFKRQAPSGLPLVQHSLQALLDLVAQGAFSLETAVTRACHAPATLFGVERRGFLKDGRAVEVTQSYYRGDTYDFVAELNDPA